MMFQTKERKIIIISVLALLVAVVTFGLLGSSGTFKNSVYDLGGAIVGFLATAYLLNRFYGTDPGEIPKHELKGQAFSSEESVKILDMRNQKPVAPGTEATHENRVVLIDHYKLRKLGNDPEITFPYATNGLGMEGSCISHYMLQKWIDKTQESAELGEDKHLKKQYEIRLNVREIAKGEIIYVHNAVIYKNAFDGKQKDWFHSHVNLPTKSLTIILLFPDGQRCKSIAGYEKVGKNAATEVGSDKGMPIIVDDGKLSYWRIANPLLGAGYKVEWEWDNVAKPGTAAV
jgi:hypothetical protein